MKPKRFFVCLILWPFVAVFTGAGAATEMSWPGWTIPAVKLEDKGALAIVTDDDAESRRKSTADDGKEVEQPTVLEQRVSRRGIARGVLQVARTPLIAWAQLEPGVYRISARIKVDGDHGVIGTPIEMHVDVDRGFPVRPAVGRSFTSVDFGEEEGYQEVSFLYEVAAAGDRRLPARTIRHAWHASAWADEIYPDAKPAVEPRAPEPSKGFSIGITLPVTKYSATTGMPPNSMRTLRLDWLKIQRESLSPGLTVRYVRPQKLWLRPGAETAFEVLVENFGDADLTRTLQLTLTHGLAEQTTIHNESVTVPAGQSTAVTVPWQTTADTPQWGYRVTATALDGETVEHQATDVFVIYPRCYTVHVSGSNSRSVDPFRAPESYANLTEVFAATHGDMAAIMPPGDAWISGMSGGAVVYTWKSVRSTTEYNRRQGAMTAFYLFAGGTGTPMMDLYAEHPEWVSSKGVATDVIYTKNAERQAQIAAWDWEHKGWNNEPFEPTPHIEMHVNHRFPELMERIVTQTLEFIRRTGYEACRFDVGILGPRAGDKTIMGTPHEIEVDNPMQVAADNFNYFRSRVEAEFPDFEWGANMDTYAYLETIQDRDAEIRPAEEFPEFIAFCQAKGMFMDEATMSAPLFDHYMNRFEDCWYFMNLKRAITRRYGGVYELFSPHRDGAGHFCHDDIYFALMSISSGSHYVGSYAAPPYSEDSMGAFATRFAEFLWSPGLMPLADAADRIYVDSPAELWYADGTVFEVSDERYRMVVPLINPPVVERFRRNKTNELPPPIDEPFEIEIAVPEGYTAGTAWMLTWEPRVAAEALKVELDGESLRVRFPGIKLFRTLVAEFTK